MVTKKEERTNVPGEALTEGKGHGADDHNDLAPQSVEERNLIKKSTKTKTKKRNAAKGDDSPPV